MKTYRAVAFFILSLIFAPSQVLAGDFYAHIGGGIGMDFFSSSDIEDDLPGYTIINLGFPITLVGRIGYKNVFQAEYRKLLAGSDHVIQDSGFYVTYEIDMEYDENDVLFKINPFFGSWGDDSDPFFLVFGKGNITYKDGLNDGYEGDATVFGLEWTELLGEKSTMITYSLKHIQTDFDGGSIPDMTGRTYEATDLVFEMTASFGFSF